MKKISAGLVASLLLVLPGIAAAGGYYNTGGYGYGNQEYYNYPAQPEYYSWGNPSMSMPEYGCNGYYQYTPCQVAYQPQPQPHYYTTYNYPQYQYYPQQYYNPYVYNTNTNTNTNINNNVNTINIGNYPLSYGYTW
jgi:hypothetical protein